MPDIKKCFEILGVSPGASDEEIKEAVRDLVKVWHPDRFSGDPRLQQKAQEKLKEINKAYEAVKAYIPLLRTKSRGFGHVSESEQAGPEQQKDRGGKGDDLVERLKRRKKEPLPDDDVKKVAQAIAMMLKDGKKKR